MPDFLLDSCVLIRHLRRHRPTTDLMAALALEGMREHEREITMRLLDALVSYPLDAVIADLAGDYIRHYRARGTTLDKPDAIIAATAVHHGLVLVTYNVKHFPMPELQLYEGGSTLPNP